MTNPLDPRVIYPLLHASLGYGFLLSFYFLLPASWFWWAMLALEVVLINKEVWFDPWKEGPTEPFLYEGATDFAWYHAGYAIAGVALFMFVTHLL